MEAVGQLAGGVAHDFNNLLTVVLANVGAALAELERGEPGGVQDELREIGAAAERASVLTRQLLAFSRRQVVQRKIVDLNEVIRAVEPMVRRVVREDIRVETALAAELWRVSVDPGQVEQVLLNLVLNAQDAMPGGGSLTIRTENRLLREGEAGGELRPGEYVLLAVADTGVGMDEETRRRAFEPFFTTKGVGEGTGLGLSTVYGIVKQSEGHVFLHSAPGRGTTVEVYLPKAVGVGAAVPPEPAGPAEQLRGTETVLLVEDNDQVRAVARRVLQGSGYVVLEARRGDEALLLAERHEGPIHLLLTDVVMPEVGGRELAQQVRARRPQIAVLYTSGYSSDWAGVNEPDAPFLPKPFTAAELIQKVREVLDRASKP